MEKEPQNEMPFQPIKDGILGKGAFVKVSEFCEQNGCVIKELNESDFDNEQVRKIQNYLGVAQEKFPEQYAKFFPKTQCVIGKNKNGKRSLFIVQEKIIGENLENHILSEESQKDFKELISFLIDLYITTFDEERGMTIEFDTGKNYIFGHKMDETKAEDRIYIIDFMPVFRPELSIFKNWLRHVIDEVDISDQDAHELLAKLDVLKQK